MSDSILSIGTWATNAAMIADVARLRYLSGSVLDVTYGELGGFWKSYRPEALTTSDLNPAAPTDHHWDYRHLPLVAGAFDVVVFDPPYRLRGTPAYGEQDRRYGTTERTSRASILEDICAGAVECYRVCAERLLVKCMDQVEGGRMRWQTDLVTRAVEDLGGRKIDRFDIPTAGRPQPFRTKICPRCAGTGTDPFPEPLQPGLYLSCRMVGCEHGRVPSVQATALRKHSTLLIFAKPKARA